MALGLYCECGTCVPVVENDAGSSVTCPCGRRIVVPLLEEFRDCPLLISAGTVERRVQRLIAEGVLPNIDTCLRCGDPKTQVVNVEVECERARVRASGGQRFLIIPLLWGFYWSTWHEEERVEFRGRDTDVRAPVALCGACLHQVRAPTGSWVFHFAALLLVAGGILAYFHIWTGLGIAMAGLLGLIFLVVKKRLSLQSWQRMLKNLLGKVPVYRQVLKRYPRAAVIVPNKEFEGKG